MPTPEALLTFVVAGIILNLIPGPDILYIVGRSLAQGRVAGIVSCLGIAAGCLVHVAAATLGLSALMLTLPHAYDVVKWVGAAYLVWIGAKMLLAKSSRLELQKPAPVPLWRVFRQGAITNILNPKIALFYGSVFATAFPAHPSNTLVALAVAMVFLNSVVWHTGLAWALSRPAVQRAYLRHFRALNRGAGLLVGAIGLKLIAGTLLEFRSPGA